MDVNTNLNQEFPTIFVKIRSTDQTVIKLQEQIEKYCMFFYWVSKAIPLLQEYKKIFDSIEFEKDIVARGKLIQNMECFFMSSISVFLRCFHEQKSLHLNIKDVTKQEKLLECYSQIKSLRDDEFVHWKGIRSSVYVTYSFKAISTDKCEFAKEIHGNYNESIGPQSNTESLLELFNTTLKYIDDKRLIVIEKLRNYLSNSTTLLGQTEIINELGMSILKKNK